MVAKQQKKKSDYKLTPQEYRAALKEVQLDEIMLEECTVRLRRERLDKALEITIVEKTSHEIQGDNVVSVNHAYMLTASSGAKKDFALRLTCTFGLKYSSKTTLTEDFMEIFQDQNILLNTWPYFREFVQSMTQRMNIPPLTLPLLKK